MTGYIQHTVHELNTYLPRILSLAVNSIAPHESNERRVAELVPRRKNVTPIRHQATFFFDRSDEASCGRYRVQDRFSDYPSIEFSFLPHRVGFTNVGGICRNKNGMVFVWFRCLQTIFFVFIHVFFNILQIMLCYCFFNILNVELLCVYSCLFSIGNIASIESMTSFSLIPI